MTATVDNFGRDIELLDLPANDGVPITPSNTDEIATGVTRGLYVGGAGNIVVVMNSGAELTLNNIAVGIIHPMRVRQVKATNTTTTGILGFY